MARRLVVSGRVQGVGFRHFTQEAAVREGVSGLARNTPDGRVDVYVEGEREAVDRIERAIRTGPPSAQVLDVNVEADEPGGNHRTFVIG